MHTSLLSKPSWGMKMHKVPKSHPLHRCLEDHIPFKAVNNINIEFEDSTFASPHCLEGKYYMAYLLLLLCLASPRLAFGIKDHNICNEMNGAGPLACLCLPSVWKWIRFRDLNMYNDNYQSCTTSE